MCFSWWSWPRLRRRSGGDPLEPTLAFFPENAPLLAVVDTDSGSDQRRALRRITKRFAFSSQLIPQLQDPELAPVLGNPAVIGASDPRALSDRRKLVVAIRPRRPEKLSELRRRWVESGRFTLAGTEAGFRILRDSTGDLNAFDGETLVLSGSRPLLSNALRRGREEDGIDAGRFGEALEASRATRSWRCAWTPRRWRWRARRARGPRRRRSSARLARSARS